MTESLIRLKIVPMAAFEFTYFGPLDNSSGYRQISSKKKQLSHIS
jgi:hypothetical protein